MGFVEFIHAVTNKDRKRREEELQRDELARLANGGIPTINQLADLSLQIAKMAQDPIDAKMAHAIPSERLIPQIRARARMQLKSMSSK